MAFIPYEWLRKKLMTPQNSLNNTASRIALSTAGSYFGKCLVIPFQWKTSVYMLHRGNNYISSKI